MKESVYNLCARDSRGTYYLFNARRGTLHVMSTATYAAYWAAVNGSSWHEEAAHTLRELIYQGFLIEDGADELMEIEAEHREARQARDRLDLVIAPSMACNLDCPYCFETNRYGAPMRGEVQERTVALVRRAFVSGTQHLAVTWYGGEPLLALSIIERLSTRLLALCEEYGRGYLAEVVTNGTLMTDGTAKRLAASKVKRAQITLDGTPDLHNVRRVGRHLRPTFDRIIEGIECALPHMQVAIRINVCRTVAARLEELLQFLAARGLNRSVSVYVALLQAAPGPRVWPRGSAPHVPLAEPGHSGFDLLSSEEAADLELHFDELLWKHGFSVPDRLPRPRATACIADKENAWVIEANGQLQKCYWTAGLATEAVGRLTDYGAAAGGACEKWQNWAARRNAECQRCIMLPLCRGRCPLRHLSSETNVCPPFKRNWLRYLTRAVRTADDQLLPVRLPLIGPGKLGRREIVVALDALKRVSAPDNSNGSP